ncbi:Glycosyltransferase involved in cell wall bisynthesis [Fodinibius roseus]|uniref:Glycosyltransferase involved in cell wall bisynthesis n=1 Tax=Fodinibius roseus TaxID=1194090 RepID=A0A1M4SQQ9_9BACT|nr:glycosyltransferase [Fodinibius roseus]SHE34531.1 Glycosyltransferase involved in cell wall bisynthesis [Fodinibius roseus]
MKKICLIIHSLGIGGMERVMHQLAISFSEKEDVEIHLILIGKKREIVHSLPPSINIHLPQFEFDESSRVASTLKTMRFLRKEVKKIKPDTILSFGEYWNNLVLLSLYGLSHPLFISDRSEPGKDLGKIHNFLRRVLYPCATGYIAQTGEAKEICLSNGWNDNIRVIGNPVRQISTNGQEQREKIVLTVGRLIKTKHFDQLIRMFVKIGNPDWKLVIVGGDAKKQSLSKELDNLIHEMGAGKNVFLEGEQMDVDKYYKKSKIFAFTSSSEGFPNVIGEALSAGLPIVAYDCMAGPSDMIDNNKNGFLVPLFNEEDFKNRLEDLMHNQEKRERFRQNAQKSIQEYCPDKIANKFYSFITSHESNY